LPPKFEHQSSECWFCLSNPNVEVHLICWVGNEVYVALAKGGLVDEHCLIVTVGHKSSVLELEKGAIVETQNVKTQLKKFFKTEERELLFFELKLPTKNKYHTHIQCIPLKKKNTKSSFRKYKERIGKIGFESK